MNAKAKWESDPEFRQRFQEAARAARRERAAQGQLPSKPTVEFSPTLKMRSTWERDFARLLDAYGLRWKYEPTHIRLPEGGAYTPDFLVKYPFATCYVEIHRVETRTATDLKFAKMAAARRQMSKPLLLVGEAGMKKVRQQLRRSEKDKDFWYRLFMRNEM